MKSVDFDWNGQVLHLLLNGTALFDIYDKYGYDADLLDLLEGNDKKSYLNTCWILYKLAEQGELARRFLGHDHEKPPSVDRLAALMLPQDVPRAKRAATKAIRLGFGVEHPEGDGSVDIGLLELQKKTELRPPAPSIFRRLLNFFVSLFQRRRH